MTRMLKAALLALAATALVASPATAKVLQTAQDKPERKLAGAEVKPGETFNPFPAANGWKAWGALAWEDFQGPVDEKERKKGHRAGTVATFDAWWEYSFSESPVKLRDGSDSGFIDITIKFERFASATAFQTKHSWKDLEGLSDEQKAKLLAHEQGHFDLAEVFRRRWQSAADAAAAKLTAEQKQRTKRANERNREKAKEQLERELFEALKKELQELEKLHKQLLKELDAAQKLYDSYTGHGTDDGKQAEWNTWIAGQLGATPPADPPPGTKK